ncbi:MAG TPA: hypothetical protein VFC21_12665 [Bryobacteraceae bacterium]|nr:hypothetical protein [Bryobacteraceae bacterium]
MKKFIAGTLLGIGLTAGGAVLYGQNERAMHPRIAKAVVALKDAKAYMEAAPHDFGGHRADAIRASDEAIRQLNFALQYRGSQDRR